jgi:heme exporter protein D
MNLNYLLLGGYSYFVWSAFVFAFVSCFFLYFKTKKELNKQEMIFLSEFKQQQVVKIEVVKQGKASREILSSSTSF